MPRIVLIHIHPLSDPLRTADTAGAEPQLARVVVAADRDLRRALRGGRITQADGELLRMHLVLRVLARLGLIRYDRIDPPMPDPASPHIRHAGLLRTLTSRIAKEHAP